VVSATIAATRHAVPASRTQQQLWEGFFAGYYRGDRIAERIWHAAGVQTRHGVVDPRVEDVSTWGTAARMRRYIAEALPLAKDALTAALGASGHEAGDVALLTVASCTGYVTPGLDILLARDLGLVQDVQRLFVGHMGCYAAIPALSAVANFVRVHQRPALLLCLELPSLHIQPPPTARDVDQVVAHALFGDAAAACVVAPAGPGPTGTGPAGPGLAIVDITAITDPTAVEHMTWDVTDFGFRMSLSPLVPEALARHLRPAVDALLARHGLGVPDVRGWAIHPGGPRILEVAADRLGLADTQTAASYAVLRDCGNCSSATVLLVVERLVGSGVVAPGDHIVAVAFGPGLTLYAALLRAT
jgi:alkylresorcinol/alkylpyrone synthase